MFDLVTNGEVACRFASFETAASAETLVRFINKNTAGFSRIQKRKEKPTIDWREREQGRFDNGNYEPVPWADHELFTQPSNYTTASRFVREYKDHFVHVAQGNKNKVAYTPDEEYGAADRQIVVSPGRYLKKFYGDLLSDSTIASFCAEFENSSTFKILRSSEDIISAYIKGPSSCMSKEASIFDSPIHPVAIYGDSDLSLAVLVDEEGDVTARALIWEDRSIYGRIYGDDVRLLKHLEGMGYREGGFEGARLQAIEHRGHYVCPYIDWIEEASIERRDGKDWLVLGSGNLSVQNTGGYAENGHCCPWCGEHFDEGDGVWLSDTEEEVCQSCYESDAFTCDCCWDAYSESSHHVHTHDGYVVCECCVDRGRVYFCDECGEYYWYESEIVGQTSSGSTVCESCSHDFVYDEDDAVYLTTDEAEEKAAEKAAEEAEAEEADHAYS